MVLKASRITWYSIRKILMESFHSNVSFFAPSNMDTNKWVSMYRLPTTMYNVQDMPDMKWMMQDSYSTIPSTFSSDESHTIHDTYPYHGWAPITHTMFHSNLGQSHFLNATGNINGVHTNSSNGNHPPIYSYGGLNIPHGNEWNITKKEKTINSGPIPANPLRIYKDSKGVDWISFAYSRERIRTEYTIRGDVETVDLDTLSEEFKQQNCIYPRARVPPEQYTGTRHRYETECNSIGWALAKLNPCLRNKRGLIQRAVDSWRNKEPSLRSRRIRRMVALNNLHCIRDARDMSFIIPHESPLPARFRQVASKTDVTLPPHHTICPNTVEKNDTETKKTQDTQEKLGELIKKPKYILLDDIKKETRVRVRINLDDVNLEEIPDAFRRDHCLFPRRFIPILTTYGEPIFHKYEYEFQTEEAKKEQMINEIGWKLAWLNMRLFANRLSFLQRAVDAYRNKIELVTCEEKWGTRKGRKAWFSKVL